MKMIDKIKLFLQKILPSYRVSLRIEEQLYRMEYNMKLMNKRQEMMFWYCMRKENEILTETKKRFFEELPKAEGALRKRQLSLLNILVQFDEFCKKNHIGYWIDCGNLLGAIRNGGFIPWDDDIDIAMSRREFNHLANLISNNNVFELKYLYDYKNIYVMPKIFSKKEDASYFIDIIVYEEVYCSNLQGVQEQWEIRRILQNKLRKELFHCLGLNASERDYREIVNINDEKKIIAICNKYSEKFCKLYQEGELTYFTICMEFPQDLTNYMRCFEKQYIYPLKQENFEGYLLPQPNQAEKYLEVLYGNIYDLPNDFGYQKHI